MKRYLLLAAKIIVLISILYFGGVRLANFVIYRYMEEMPLWMYDSIRFVLDHTGNADIRDPDDLSIISIFATILACWIVTAIITLTSYTFFRRLINHKFISRGRH